MTDWNIGTFSFKSLFFLLGILLGFLSGCQPRKTVSLALLGDLMVGRGVEAKPDSLAYLVQELSSADLALANLESPLATTSDQPGANAGGRPVAPTGYNLCASSDAETGTQSITRADLLATWGFDLLALANNHNLDCSLEGPAETRSALEEAGIASIGPGMEPVFRKVNGLDLAFLAFENISYRLDENAALQAIRSAHQTGAVVIISVHWGMEYQGGASEQQKSLAQEFAEAGAALVWGHHPHVLQPAAWIETAHGKTLVLYSLGNALFDQRGLEDTRRSALVMVTLDADGVDSGRVVPFKIDVLNSRVVQPDVEMAKKIRERLNLP